MIRILLVFFMIVLFSSCSTDYAGGGVEEGNVVAGLLYTSQGTVVTSAEVTLCSSDYNPVTHSGFERKITTNDGSYTFKDIPSGVYRISMRSADGAQLGKLFTLQSTGGEVIHHDTLQPTGALRIMIDAPLSVEDTLYIPGSSYSSVVPAHAAEHLWKGLPATMVDEVVSHMKQRTLISDVQIEAGDTLSFAVTASVLLLVAPDLTTLPAPIVEQIQQIETVSSVRVASTDHITQEALNRAGVVYVSYTVEEDLILAEMLKKCSSGVVVAHLQYYPLLGFCGPVLSTDFGISTMSNQMVTYYASNHPLLKYHNGGATSNMVVDITLNNGAHWAQAQGEVTILGVESPTASRALLFVYEKDASLLFGKATARRVGLFAGDVGLNYTAREFLPAAILWARGDI